MSKEIKLLIFLICGFIILAVVGWGCNPAARLQRKEDKLVNEATASKKVLSRIAPSIFELWPCANDTSFVFKPGRIDSIPYVVTFDTADRSHIRDSVLAADLPGYQKECNAAVDKAFDEGVKFAMKAFSKVKIPYQTPDTLKYAVVDRRMIRVADDSLTAARQALQFWKGQSAAWQTRAEKLTKEFNTLLLCAGFLIACAIGFGVYKLLLKSKLPI